MKAVTVIGMGDEGCVGLSSKAVGAVARAQVLAGGERHLAFFPQFEGKTITIKGDLKRAIDEIAQASQESTVCVLSSGDPLFYGVGNLIAKKVGREHVEFLPAPSSIQQAFARAGMKWDDARVFSLHGQPIEGLVARLQRVRKAACLTDDRNTPQRIGQYLAHYGETQWKAIVCENLGSTRERVREFEIEQLKETSDFSELNVVILCRSEPNWQEPPQFACLDEEAYARRMPKNGLITKREIRALSLAALRLHAESVVWDIGAGSGSVAIEASKIAYEGSTFAIEVDPEGVELCRQNALVHKADNVQVVAGRAPEALAGLKAPDAVFIGGTKGSMGEILATCLGRLSPRGRLVANAVTLDNVAEAYESFKKLGLEPEVNLVQISRGQKLKQYLRYEALNPIHIFSITKPENFGGAS